MGKSLSRETGNIWVQKTKDEEKAVFRFVVIYFRFSKWKSSCTVYYKDLTLVCSNKTFKKEFDFYCRRLDDIFDLDEIGTVKSHLFGEIVILFHFEIFVLH